MKCERAMELFATGSALGRLWARRHAAHCSGCAAEISRLSRIADVLAAVEPLTPAQRALWTSASTDPRPAAQPRFRHHRAWLAAAGLVLAVGLAFVALWPSPVNRPIKSIDVPIVKTENPRRQSSPEMVQELDALTSDLHALSQELTQLSRQAELLDERRDAEALAHRFLAMNRP